MLRHPPQAVPVWGRLFLFPIVAPGPSGGLNCHGRDSISCCHQPPGLRYPSEVQQRIPAILFSVFFPDQAKGASRGNCRRVQEEHPEKPIGGLHAVVRMVGVQERIASVRNGSGRSRPNNRVAFTVQ